MKKTNWPGRRASMAFTTALVLLGSSFALSGTSGASHPEVSLAGSNFEIDTDANLIVDDTGQDDWASIRACSSTVTAPCEVRKTDDPSGSTDNSFGNGTKEDSATPSVVHGGIPPNKSDLKQFGLYQEGTTLSGFLNLFWTRVQDPNGTTNMDFELNQASPPTNGNPAARTTGDLLISYDLSNGGTNPTLWLRTWDGSAWVNARDLTSTSNATGSINATAITALNSDGLGALSARTFGEAQLALTAIFGTTPAGCTSFGSAYLKSRSSDSFPAALKDFISPMAINLSNCGSITINKMDGTTALAGAVFTLYKDNATVGGTRGTEDVTLDNPNTVAVDNPWTCTSIASGACTFSNVPFGDYWLVESTRPPGGYNWAADTQASVTVADPAFTTTIQNTRQPGTISIHKTDDAGAFLAGAVFTLYPDLAPTGAPMGTEDVAGTLSCMTTVSTTPLSQGDCSITSVPLGQYWVVETTTPTGHTTAAAVNVSITTGGQVVPLTFVNARQFKIIVLVCQEGTNKLYASKVAFDGATLPTVNNSLATSASPDQACSLGGATLSPVGASDSPNHYATVDIP